MLVEKPAKVRTYIVYIFSLKNEPIYDVYCISRRQYQRFLPPSLLTALPWFGGLIRTGDFIFEYLSPLLKAKGKPGARPLAP